MTLFASGANYELRIVGGIAHNKVIPRPDLTLAEGAASANEMIARHAALRARPDVKGLILDQHALTSAPGPKTQASLAEEFAAWEAAGRRVAVVINADHAVQAMIMGRLVATHAPTQGRVVGSLNDGRLWVLGLDPTPVGGVFARPAPDDQL